MTPTSSSAETVAFGWSEPDPHTEPSRAHLYTWHTHTRPPQPDSNRHAIHLHAALAALTRHMGRRDARRTSR